MLIDGFTVAAQAVNFVVLVWLMKRFLYGPILKAIDGREQRIAAQLADAEAQKVEAGHQRDTFAHKNALFEQERSALLARAVTEADAERARLLDEARSAADALSHARAQAFKDDSSRLNQAISSSMQQEVIAIARKTLAGLADADLDQQIVVAFVHRLQGLDAAARAVLADAAARAAEPALIRSAFPLDDPQCTTLQAAIHQILSMKVELRYEVSPELIGGIELRVGGQKLSWSIAGDLAALEKRMARRLFESQQGIVAQPAAADSVDPAGSKAMAA